MHYWSTKGGTKYIIYSDKLNQKQEKMKTEATLFILNIHPS